MDKAALILQPFGLGDCIFAQGIAHHLMDSGYRIYWPVDSQYIYDLKRAYPRVAWVPEDLSNLYPDEKVGILKARAVPIRWSNSFQTVPYKYVMRAKYDMLGLDWNLWKKYGMWDRCETAEDMLAKIFDEYPKQYNLVSTAITGKFRSGEIPASYYDNGLPTIRINKIGSFSLFDWAKIIERAEEIHFVASSNIYILELLKLRASKICIYPRPHEPHEYYDYILRSHNYKLM